MNGTKFQPAQMNPQKDGIVMGILELLDQGMKLFGMVGLPHLGLVLLISFMSIYIPKLVF